MQLTDEELKIIAYIRAEKENKTFKKTKKIAIGMFFIILADAVLVATETISGAWGFMAFIILMILMAYINYRIRKPEKLIADRILKEG